MQHDKWRTQALGEINCLKGLFNGTLTFLAVGLRQATAIGREFPARRSS